MDDLLSMRMQSSRRNRNDLLIRDFDGGTTGDSVNDALLSVRPRILELCERLEKNQNVNPTNHDNPDTSSSPVMLSTASKNMEDLTYLDPSMNEMEMSHLLAALRKNSSSHDSQQQQNPSNLAILLFAWAFRCSDSMTVIHPFITTVIGNPNGCCSSLVALYLTYNNLTDRHAEWIGESLKANTTRLKLLDLTGNWISGRGVRAIANGLQSNTALIQLTLNGNRPIGKEGCIALGSMLEQQHHSHLQVLDLAKLHLDDMDILYLLYGVHPTDDHDINEAVLREKHRVHHSLNTLELKNNDITDLGCWYIATYLKFNASLTSIGLQWNPKISCIGLRDIGHVFLNTNYTVEHVDYWPSASLPHNIVNINNIAETTQFQQERIDTLTRKNHRMKTIFNRLCTTSNPSDKNERDDNNMLTIMVRDNKPFDSLGLWTHVLDIIQEQPTLLFNVLRGYPELLFQHQGTISKRSLRSSKIGRRRQRRRTDWTRRKTRRR